jgi:diaminopimelate decarboxylase
VSVDRDSAAPRADRLAGALGALRRLEPHAHACWFYDLDALATRAARFRRAFVDLSPLSAYALKANALPALLETLRESGIGAEAGSLGELEIAAAAGFPAGACVLNGNGRTPEEAEWAARRGVHSVNADHVGELDLLQRSAASAERPLRVALRVNPGIDAAVHPYVATGHGEAKFGVGPGDALEAWASRARWPHLRLDGVHIHVGSQLLASDPLDRAAALALDLADESARRGAPLSLVNLGGGFGIDYARAGAEFPLEAHALALARRAGGRRLEWVLEPGRWLVAPVGVLVSEVLWIKHRDGRRFVVLAAGLNDLIRPALYGARHLAVPLAPRAGAMEPAHLVGPVCESADVFAENVPLPPLEPGDLIAILDAGAYGASMSSNYNGRGRLAEIVLRGGRLFRARGGETPADLVARRSWDALEADPHE